MLHFDYAFIGAGRMATALAGGIVKAGLAGGERIAASDPSKEVAQLFSEAVPGATVATDNAEIANQSAMVILAVKPQVMDTAIQSLDSAIGEEHIVVSIAAGVTIARLERQLPPGTRVVRVMPNTPCLVGRGASGYSLGHSAQPSDGDLVARMLGAVGIALKLPESLLDGVTGLSGSGPAFVYTVIEALAEGGVAAGLPKEVADQLAVQTVAGAAEMVSKTGLTPAELCERVTSPGGTTVAGLDALERGGFQAALIAAVCAATERSRELGEE